MARDGLSVAVRTIWPTTGPKSGTTSNTFDLKWNAAGTPSSSDWSTACADVWKFFNGTAGGAGYPTYYMGPQVYRASNSVTMDVYNLDLNDPPHYYGSPVFTVLKTPGTAGTSNPLPNEVALCLSYRAAYGSDPEHDGVTRPRAQDRGRTYIGPLNTVVITTQSAPNGTLIPVIDPSAVTNILNKFSTLCTDLQGHNWLFCVWSRKDALLKPVQMKAMNNEFDTQRRREVEPPGLLTWVAI